MYLRSKLLYLCPTLCMQASFLFSSVEQEAATSTTPVDLAPKLPTEPADWTIENVISYISFSDPPLGVHADLFRRHVIIKIGELLSKI